MPTRSIMRSLKNIHVLGTFSAFTAHELHSQPVLFSFIQLTKVLTRSDWGKRELGSGLEEMLAQSWPGL